ncbi:probable protein phosphatase 2C 27 [Triticum aestivum]|uniref:probable protein phosphatase 2C 27 n=1 Tax=Triticum aestivum TaxID=4565 RepID=UPI001D01735D|nr:probable protein phosphatase 2C 27 [Triticum aestivum]
MRWARDPPALRSAYAAADGEFRWRCRAGPGDGAAFLLQPRKVGDSDGRDGTGDGGRREVDRRRPERYIIGDTEMGKPGGPLSAEPELKMITLTKDDEFLIIGSDDIWDYSNQNSVDFPRRRLQEHNDLQRCCKEIVEETIRRGATDNLTAVMVPFHQEGPPQIRVNRMGRVERSISAEELHSLMVLLEDQ